MRYSHRGHRGHRDMEKQGLAYFKGKLKDEEHKLINTDIEDKNYKNIQQRIKYYERRIHQIELNLGIVHI